MMLLCLPPLAGEVAAQPLLLQTMGDFAANRTIGFTFGRHCQFPLIRYRWQDYNPAIAAKEKHSCLALYFL